MTAQMSWLFAVRESLASWLLFLERLPEPDAAVIDGQKGLQAAIQCLWPQAKIQRCIVHIERLARIKLTRQPKTSAGKALPHLFTFVDYPHVPRTTNHVEGGVNSRLKE